MVTATSNIPAFFESLDSFPVIMFDIITLNSCLTSVFRPTNWKDKFFWNTTNCHIARSIFPILSHFDIEPVFIKLQNTAKSLGCTKLEYLILRNLAWIPAAIVQIILWKWNEFRSFIESVGQNISWIRTPDKLFGLQSIWNYFIDFSLGMKENSLLFDIWGILFINHVLELFLLLLKKLFHVTVHLHCLLFLILNVLCPVFSVRLEQASKFQLLDTEALLVFSLSMS